MIASIRTLQSCLERNAELASGFLPARTPLIALPEPYRFVSEACDALPGHYHGAGLDCRPWLDRLFADREAERLCAALGTLDRHALESLMMKTSLLAHAYRWTGMPTDPANYTIGSVELPPALEALWTALARILGVPRVGIFYTMICHNWRLEGQGGCEPYSIEAITPDNVRIIHSWLNPPERQELQTFVVTALTMEAQGAAIVRHTKALLDAMQRSNTQEVTYRLVLIEATIAGLAAAFNQRMRKANMSPANFLKLVQPTMVWLLDHGEGPLEGASGPQACTIQLIDSLLGVPRESKLGAMIVGSRKYMLPRHREIMEAADAASGALRAFVDQADDARLREVYNQCIETMILWRVSHQKRGAMYIRGDKSTAATSYTSTGLVVKLGMDQAGLFQEAMQQHIAATKEQAFADFWDGAAFSFAHLFRYLDADISAELRSKIRTRTVPKDAIIIREGERYPGLYVIEKGEAGVLRRGGGRDKMPLARMPAGQIFGEISFIDNLGASADVVALTDIELSYLTISDLYEVIALQPQIEARLYLSLARVMAHRLRAVGDDPL